MPGYALHCLPELSRLCKVGTILMPIFTDKKTETKRDLSSLSKVIPLWAED